MATLKDLELCYMKHMWDWIVRERKWDNTKVISRGVSYSLFTKDITSCYGKDGKRMFHHFSSRCLHSVQNLWLHFSRLIGISMEGEGRKARRILIAEWGSHKASNRYWMMTKQICLIEWIGHFAPLKNLFNWEE